MTDVAVQMAEVPADSSMARHSGKSFLWRLLRQPLTVICFAGIAILIGVALFAPVLAPFDPNFADIAHRLKGPSSTHWLGTDVLGRDSLSRLLYGARTAMVTSFEAVGLAIIIGIPSGLLIGYFGGWWDRLAMRAMDILQSIPSLIFALAVIAVLGRGANQIAVAVAIVFAIILIRITRGLALRERELLYVDAARVSGLASSRILFREILPNIVGPLIVETAIMLGSAIMIVTMLSFLGLGLNADTPDWGSMLDDARQYQAMQPFMALPPGLAIMFAVLLFNFAGDSLRDALMGPQRSRTDSHPKNTKHARSSARLSGKSKTMRAGAEVLKVEDLCVTFPYDKERSMEILSGVGFNLRRGEMVGLVGESGSGKSMTALATLGLVPAPGVITRGEIRLGDQNLTAMSDAELNKVRGSEIAMIFQDSVAGLSPVHTIGQQLAEPLQVHQGLSKQGAAERAVELLSLVGIPNAARRIHDYPHQFSGGMAQRAMIAMALSCGPKVLLADEPTTALDVTIQAQVLDLLGDLRLKFDMAVLLITHDMGVVAETCDRVLVMYAGEIVEEGNAMDVLTRPRHPYSRALLAAMPRNEARVARLPTVPGTVPPPWDWPTGCRFSPRCLHARETCLAAPIPLKNGVRCIRADEIEFAHDA